MTGSCERSTAGNGLNFSYSSIRCTDPTLPESFVILSLCSFSCTCSLCRFHEQKERQKVELRRQLNLAVELHKPVVIHCRDAFDDTLAILKEVGRRGHRGGWDLLAA